MSELLNECITKYTKFIKKADNIAEVIVISAPLPTIKDGKQFGEVANAKSEIRSSLKERIELTLK